MTLDEISKWYEANKTHTMHEGHWCRTCSIGALLEELRRRAASDRCCPECSGGRPGGMICDRVWRRSHP